VAARFEPHPLELLACASLVLDARGREPAQPLHPAGQLVARSLELLQAQQVRTAGAGGARRIRGRDEGEALREDPRQLALELGDLRAQRASRGALADVGLLFTGPFPAPRADRPPPPAARPAEESGTIDH